MWAAQRAQLSRSHTNRHPVGLALLITPMTGVFDTI